MSNVVVQSAEPVRKDPKEEKILAAARELFMTLGFEATSMEIRPANSR